LGGGCFLWARYTCTPCLSRRPAGPPFQLKIITFEGLCYLAHRCILVRYCRGTSLMEMYPPGPYSWPMPRGLGGPRGVEFSYGRGRTWDVLPWYARTWDDVLRGIATAISQHHVANPMVAISHHRIANHISSQIIAHEHKRACSHEKWSLVIRVHTKPRVGLTDCLYTESRSLQRDKPARAGSTCFTIKSLRLPYRGTSLIRNTPA